ncbi:peptidase, C14B family [Formosa sp. Hel3_A1_48]|jgi:hypothetical protein|uniref:caspase family protein n=1 Tax=Formosa sp. Hel3_A1_48 TaxID=1336795 RepID=UPI00084E2A9E|nr:caspase family protein [Formosa sp. Hel3_A1_48]AOR26480.1 peptidase, C14B family [Formosa sp. Hel3_A1_48]MDG2280109.1 caspase family protein [Flavicella sp.]
MKNIFILFFSIAHFFLLSQEKEKRLALVMGNANYEKGELNNPVNDARLIASTLDSLEFDVILKENLATRRDMTNAIREFGAKRENYDVAFVYYAGHGIQIDDENFLLPTKENFFSEEDVLDYAVSVEKIMRILKSKDNQVNILILDACRDNPFESSWNNTRSLNGRGLAKIQPPTGSLIAFSTDSGQTAPDGNGDNSIYTSSLSRNMKIDDISIDQVFRNVRAEVLDQTNGQQRPLESTQLVGKSFILKKTFSLYDSTIEEIINFCNTKKQSGGLEEVIEILNTSANFYRLQKKYKEEIYLREKLINDYVFSPLSAEAPKYFSLEIRNLSSTDITYEKFKESFQIEEYNLFINNLKLLLSNDKIEYEPYIDKSYYISLYNAFLTSFNIVDNNLFSLEELLTFPKIDFDMKFLDSGLSNFWFLKKEHFDWRTNPCSENFFLVDDFDDLNSILVEESRSLISKFDSNFYIDINEKNKELVNFTKKQYPDIKVEVDRMKADHIVYVNTKNSKELLEELNETFRDYNDFFKEPSFDYNRYIDLTSFGYFILALETQISRGVFYSTLNEDDLSHYISLYINSRKYVELLLDKFSEISFEQKTKIENYNNFVVKSKFRPNFFVQETNYLLPTDDFEKFQKRKETISEAYRWRISSCDNFLYLKSEIKKKNYTILEDKELFSNWSLFGHELLYKLYNGYLKNSDFFSTSDSAFKQKLLDYEREYKLNYINRVWVINYLKLIRGASLKNNGEIFWSYELLTSLKLMENLITTKFGAKDDILFLRYVNLHIKLIISSASNFCYNPFELSEDLKSIEEENRNSQNFLLNAYLDDLYKYFYQDSPYHKNLLNHFQEKEISDLFK